MRIYSHANIRNEFTQTRERPRVQPKKCISDLAIRLINTYTFREHLRIHTYIPNPTSVIMLQKPLLHWPPTASTARPHARARARVTTNHHRSINKIRTLCAHHQHRHHVAAAAARVPQTEIANIRQARLCALANNCDAANQHTAPPSEQSSPGRF